MAYRIFVSLLLTFFGLISISHANWYGKRGDTLDNSLYQLLQGGVPDMLDRQMDAQMTLASIDKLIQEYRLRQVVQAKAADRK